VKVKAGYLQVRRPTWGIEPTTFWRGRSRDALVATRLYCLLPSSGGLHMNASFNAKKIQQLISPLAQFKINAAIEHWMSCRPSPVFNGRITVSGRSIVIRQDAAAKRHREDCHPDAWSVPPTHPAGPGNTHTRTHARTHTRARTHAHAQTQTLLQGQKILFSGERVAQG